MNVGFIDPSLAIAGGGIFLLIGALLARSSRRYSRAGIRTRAVVVAYEADTEGVWPVVEYKDSSGAEHRVQLSCSEGPPVGESLEILYDPRHPNRAIGDSFVHLWLFPIAFIGLGGMVVVIAVLAWLGVVS